MRSCRSPAALSFLARAALAAVVGTSGLIGLGTSAARADDEPAQAPPDPAVPAKSREALEKVVFTTSAAAAEGRAC